MNWCLLGGNQGEKESKSLASTKGSQALLFKLEPLNPVMMRFVAIQDHTQAEQKENKCQSSTRSTVVQITQIDTHREIRWTHLGRHCTFVKENLEGE